MTHRKATNKTNAGLTTFIIQKSAERAEKRSVGSVRGGFLPLTMTSENTERVAKDKDKDKDKKEDMGEGSGKRVCHCLLLPSTWASICHRQHPIQVDLADQKFQSQLPHFPPHYASADRHIFVQRLDASQQSKHGHYDWPR